MDFKRSQFDLKLYFPSTKSKTVIDIRKKKKPLIKHFWKYICFKNFIFTNLNFFIHFSVLFYKICIYFIKALFLLDVIWSFFSLVDQKIQSQHLYWKYNQLKFLKFFILQFYCEIKIYIYSIFRFINFYY